MVENDQDEVEKVREESSQEIFVDEIKNRNSGFIEGKHRIRGIWKVLPYRDFHHFVGSSKPWINKVVAKDPLKQVDQPKTPNELWFTILRKIDDEYELGINMTNIFYGLPSLGTFPTFNMVQVAKDMKEMKEDEEKEK